MCKCIHGCYTYCKSIGGTNIAWVLTRKPLSLKFSFERDRHVFLLCHGFYNFTLDFKLFLVSHCCYSTCEFIDNLMLVDYDYE